MGVEDVEGQAKEGRYVTKEPVKVCVYCGGDEHPAECGQPIDRVQRSLWIIQQFYSLKF